MIIVLDKILELTTRNIFKESNQNEETSGYLYILHRKQFGQNAPGWPVSGSQIQGTDTGIDCET